MSLSDKTYEKVRAILGDLDRRIDEVRARRVESESPRTPLPTPPSAAPGGHRPSGNPGASGLIGAPAQRPGVSADPSAAAAPQRAVIGRAQPLPPRDPGQNHATPRWAV